MPETVSLSKTSSFNVFCLYPNRGRLYCIVSSTENLTLWENKQKMSVREWCSVCWPWMVCLQFI